MIDIIVYLIITAFFAKMCEKEGDGMILITFSLLVGMMILMSSSKDACQKDPASCDDYYNQQQLQE